MISQLSARETKRLWRESEQPRQPSGRVAAPAAPPCSTARACTASELSRGSLHTSRPPNTHTPPPDLSLHSLLLPPSPTLRGFGGIQTNDLRWQQSVKASVGQQIPLIRSSVETFLLQSTRTIAPAPDSRRVGVDGVAEAAALGVLSNDSFIRRKKPPGSNRRKTRGHRCSVDNRMFDFLLTEIEARGSRCLSFGHKEFVPRKKI